MENETPGPQPPSAGQNAEPLYLSAARRLKRDGEDVESFLARNLEAIGNSPFPGPGCLHPDELAEYRRTGDLEEDRRQHLLNCRACAAMVEATKPSAERIRAFREAVAVVHPAPEARTAAIPVPVPVMTRIGSLLSVRTGWLTAFAAACTLTFATFAFLHRPVPGTADLASTAVPKSTAAPAAMESRLLVTAQVTAPPQKDRPFVRTPPITVTASTSDAATTVAAAAAVADVAYVHDLELFSLSGACRSRIAVYYSNLLDDYLKAHPAGDTKDIVAWVDQYKKTHATAKAVMSNDRTTNFTCESGPDTTNAGMTLPQVAVPVVPTLKAATAYYRNAAAAKIDYMDITRKDLKVAAMASPDATVKISVAKQEAPAPSTPAKSIAIK